MNRIAIFDWIKVTLKVFIIVTHVGVITVSLRQDFLFPFWIDQAIPPFWIISSFLLSASFERHGSSGTRDELTRKIFVPRLSRVMIPYTVIFSLMFILVLHRGTDLSSLACSIIGWGGGISFGGAVSTVILWLAGGVGPGGYYVPILLQMYVLVPLLYSFFRRRPYVTSLGCLAVTVMWEATLYGGLVSDQIYRLLIVRYLIFLLLGMWFYRLWSAHQLRFTVKRACLLFACLLLGVMYLTAVNYFSFPSLAGGADWKNTSWITALYSGSIFYLVFALYAAKIKKGQHQRQVSLPLFGKVSRGVTYLSKAALHVYLFQMLYFYFLNIHLQKLALLPLWTVVVGSVLVCVAAGVTGYWCENLVRKNIKAFRSRAM